MKVFLLLYVLTFASSVSAEDDILLKAPEYTRELWLQDSALESDLAVEGIPRELDKVAFMEVSKTLFGTIDPALKDEKGNLKLVAPYRFSWNKEGVWLLLKTPKGYFNLDPDNRPLLSAEWIQVQKQLQARRTPSQEKDRALNVDVSYGIRVSDPSLTDTVMKGERVHYRFWDAEGKLGGVFVTNAGDKPKHGFSLHFDHGRLSKFAHYIDGMKEGLAQRYSSDGQLREESQWKAGLRQGRCRTWNANNNVESDVTYEEGFVAPVIRYKGDQQPLLEIHKSELGVTYSDPHRGIIGKLEVGMTTNEVSNLIRTDFSEGTGLLFNHHTCDTQLRIVFKDGKVIDRRIEWNGCCCAERKE